MNFYPFDAEPSLEINNDRIGNPVLPGDRVTEHSSGFLKGRGVEINENGDFIATQCGIVEKVNKLIYVKPMHQQYGGDVGDVVVGEVIQVQDARWTVDVGAHKNASLQLAAVSLPDAAQRRRTDEDALNMREYFVEHDVIVAEVQKVTEKRDILLQTRTAKYGKLFNGMLITVSPSLIKRQPQHIINPIPEIRIILGSNGWIWIGSQQKLAGQGIQTLNYTQVEAKHTVVEAELRQKIIRYANCIKTLNTYGMNITMDLINKLYDQVHNGNINLNNPEDWTKIESFLSNQ